MSVEVYPLAAPNAQAFLLAHLAPLGACEITRHENDPLPQRVVNRLDGADILDQFCDRAVLSVHTFADSRSEAIRQGDRTHQRILLLAYELVDVPMAGGGVANTDNLRVLTRPYLSDYGVDNVFRTKAVYELELAFI